MRRLAPGPLALLAGLAGCADAPPPAPPVPAEPIALPCALGADLGRAHGYRMALEQVLDHAASAGPHALAALFAEPAGDVDDVVGLATRRDPVRIDTLVTCPDAPFLLGRAVVTDLVIGLATAVDGGADPDGLRSLILRGVYADWSDGWRLHMTPPRDAFAGMTVLHTRAEVWASIARRWAAVDVTLTVVVDGDRLVLAAPPLEAPVVDRHAPLRTGFRLIEASVDGRRADVALGAGSYLVIGGLRPGVARVRLRYEGAVPLVGENHAESRVLELHRWLPSVPYGAAARVDVTVRHPAEEALVASLPAARATGVARAVEPGPGGAWRATRLAGVTDRDPSIVLLDRAPVSRAWDDRRGSRIEVVAAAPVGLDDCAPALARIVGALAPLGPVGHVRLLAVPAVYGRHGRRADDLVIVLHDKLVDLCAAPAPGAPAAVRARHDEAVALIAHELAHGWFGRRVRVADDEASAWWEAAAEYVSSWALDDGAAAELRRKWIDDYTEQAPRDALAMAQRFPTAGALRDALSYAKGALLLAALEDRLGRDRVAAILRHHVAVRDGAIGSWLDLVASAQAVAGSQAAAWLHRALFTPGWPGWIDPDAPPPPGPSPRREAPPRGPAPGR